jgi:hypothetical protein
MNIASLMLHRLNTHTLCSVQLTVLSLSPVVLSFYKTRKRNGPIILPFVSHFSLSTTREEERVKEKKTFIISGDTKGPFVHLLHRFSLLYIHYHIDAR